MTFTTRNRRPLLLVVLAAVVLLAGTASAGWFDKKKPKAEKMPTNRLIRRTPTQSYMRGQLEEGRGGKWTFGPREVRFTPDVTVLDQEGKPGTLKAGVPVLVSGTVMGDILVVTHVRSLKPGWKKGPTLLTEGEATPSEVDPNVGTLKDVPQ